MIATTTNKVIYNCNGSQTVFSFSFKIFEKTDIVVILTDSDGNETPLTYITDYTVTATNNDFSQGGDVTTVETYASGNKLTIMRVINNKQESDYENNEKFDASVFENDLDRAAARDQQIQEQIDRVIHVPVSDETADLEIPTVAARAGNFLAFDAEGEPIAAEAVTGAPVTNFMKTVLDDETAGAARTTLDVHSKTNSHKSVTRIIASSDSDSEYQSRADTVINTSADAGAAINTILTTVNGLGGGKILALPGTYNIETIIAITSNIILKGMGYGTVFKRNASIDRIIDISSASNCILRDFWIDGNKTSYTGAGFVGILGDSTFTNYTNRFINICSHDNDDYGFWYCFRMDGCYSFNNGADGFRNCSFLNNCYSRNNTNGYQTCYHLSNCLAEDNTGDGFNSCINMSNCFSDDNDEEGFMGCGRITGCKASNNTKNGFNSCSDISSCYSGSNTENGFKSCFCLVSCKAMSNTLYGFDDCKSMGHNRSTSNTSGQYNVSYADYAGTQAVADTSAGGWNA